MVDAKGSVAAYTGPRASPRPGNTHGEQYSVQANLMANAASGPPWRRRTRARRATSPSGCSPRSRRPSRRAATSAAASRRRSLVVKGQSSGKPWADRLFDLRVEDSAPPLVELRRLVTLRRAYHLEDAGDEAIAAKRPAEALRFYEQAMKLAPDVVELQFWAAVSMYTNGREAEALKLFRAVFAREARWVPLIARLPKAASSPTTRSRWRRCRRRR